MIAKELLESSMAYAEQNFLNENARHLQVDKQFIRENFDLKHKRVLDFGCGMGGMSLWYAKNWDCHVHGIDIDGFHIEVANQLKDKHLLPNACFEKRDILTQPLNAQYDFIFMNDVAEHIPYPTLKAILTQLSASLAPGGRIMVSYPPWEGPYASHVTRVTKLPWCQFLPQTLLEKWIERKNMALSGEHESDLLSAWRGLNRLTHERLQQLSSRAGLYEAVRVSHSFLSRFKFSNWLNVRLPILKFLISKELLVLERCY